MTKSFDPENCKKCPANYLTLIDVKLGQMILSCTFIKKWTLSILYLRSISDSCGGGSVRFYRFKTTQIVE